MKSNTLSQLSTTALGFAALSCVVSCTTLGEQSVTGIITDASMNAMSIVTNQGDTLAFSTVDADRSDVNGIALGDTATLFFMGEVKTGDQMNDAVKMLVSPVVSPLTGVWIQPIEGLEGQTQGIRFENNGTAASVNMATLIYNSWFMDGDRLILSGLSKGNGQNIEFMDTVKIAKLTADSLVLDRNGYMTRYVKTKPANKN